MKNYKVVEEKTVTTVWNYSYIVEARSQEEALEKMTHGEQEPYHSEPVDNDLLDEPDSTFEVVGEVTDREKDRILGFVN